MAFAASPAPRPGNSATLVDLPRGHLLLRSLQTDSAVQYYLYVPGRGGEGAPVFVTVHGLSRNAEEHATLFVPQAETRGVVLVAPLFDEREHDDFQRLGRADRGRRADLTLDTIVGEVASMTGASVEKIRLFGFSGGAQFAHRYTMAHPERVARAAVASAGWYTFPDPRTDYPYGTRQDGSLPGVVFDPAKFLRVPIAVFVGLADTTSSNLRQNAQVDGQQGRTRVARARSWTAAMRQASEALRLEPLVSLQEIPGIGHSFRQFMEEGNLGDRVFRAFFEADSGQKYEPDLGTQETRSGWLRPIEDETIAETQDDAAAAARFAGARR